MTDSLGRSIWKLLEEDAYGQSLRTQKGVKESVFGYDAQDHVTSITNRNSSVKNVFDHWKKHGTEFPEFLNAKQYVEGANSFLHNSPTGTLVKIRINGDIFKYNPGTNMFGVMDVNGVPRTLFRPNGGMEYWIKQ